MDYYIDDGLGNTYLSLENPIIHVCNSIDTIKKIIDKGFRFSYCKERIGDANRYVELSYPLISFSDLNWDKAIHILRTYGHLIYWVNVFIKIIAHLQTCKLI
jgi:hypothetical protein